MEACGDEEDSKLQPDDPPVQRAIGYLAIRGASCCTGNQQSSEQCHCDRLEGQRHHVGSAGGGGGGGGGKLTLLPEGGDTCRQQTSRVSAQVSPADWRSELACKGRLQAACSCAMVTHQPGPQSNPGMSTPAEQQPEGSWQPSMQVKRQAWGHVAGPQQHSQSCWNRAQSSPSSTAAGQLVYGGADRPYELPASAEGAGFFPAGKSTCQHALLAGQRSRWCLFAHQEASTSTEVASAD